MVRGWRNYSPLWQRGKGDDDLSEVQKEDKEETDEIEKEGSMGTQTHPPLEGEIEESGISIKMTMQDNNYGYFTISCMDTARDWFQVRIRCPKNKMTRMRI